MTQLLPKQINDSKFKDNRITVFLVVRYKCCSANLLPTHIKYLLDYITI